jgi:hypothetical protein
MSVAILTNSADALHLRDRPAEGRLCEQANFCRPAEAAFRGHGDDGRELVEREHYVHNA